MTQNLFPLMIRTNASQHTLPFLPGLGFQPPHSMLCVPQNSNNKKRLGTLSAFTLLTHFKQDRSSPVPIAFRVRVGVFAVE